MTKYQIRARLEWIRAGIEHDNFTIENIINLIKDLKK